MNFLKQFYNLIVSRERRFTSDLRTILGFTPINISIYKLAFQHSSVSIESHLNNERLEFLGDAILGSIVADYLFKRFPFKKEGFLTEMRAKMVSRNQLNRITIKMGLDSFVQFKQPDQPNRNSIFGNALEALIGAIYLDKGYRVTERFVLDRMINVYFDIQELEFTELNFKSKLLEWGQKNNKSIKFRLVEESNIDNHPFFKIGVFINGKKEQVGEDFSKKKAEQKAAEHAIQQLGIPIN